MLISVSRHRMPARTEVSLAMGEPRTYQIWVRGLLGPQGSAWFDGLTVIETTGGDTTITGRLADQSALHGVLARVRDLGLELVAVTLEPEPAPSAAAEE